MTCPKCDREGCRYFHCTDYHESHNCPHRRDCERHAVDWRAEALALRTALEKARLHHGQLCPTAVADTYPCECGAAKHNRSIDAALAKKRTEAGG